MNFDERYTLAIAELKRTPIVEGNYAPPLHRFLRGRGVRIKPPHYNSIGMNIVTTGRALCHPLGRDHVVHSVAKSETDPRHGHRRCACRGHHLRLFMALYYRWSFNQNALTKWDKLEPTSDLETPKEEEEKKLRRRSALS